MSLSTITSPSRKGTFREADDEGFRADHADRRPPRTHNLTDLAALAEQPLDPRLAALQVFAVEARYEEGPFPLPASREELLALLEAELERCERAVAAAG